MQDILSDVEKVIFNIKKLNKKRLNIMANLIDGNAAERDNLLEEIGLLKNGSVSLGTLMVAIIVYLLQLNSRIEEIEKKIEDLTRSSD